MQNLCCFNAGELITDTDYGLLRNRVISYLKNGRKTTYIELSGEYFWPSPMEVIFLTACSFSQHQGMTWAFNRKSQCKIKTLYARNGK